MTCDVKYIVEKYLIENKFDGLSDGFNCSCEIGNLFLCNEDNITGCQAAYKRWIIKDDAKEDTK